jgi:hypothetical protein
MRFPRNDTYLLKEKVAGLNICIKKALMQEADCCSALRAESFPALLLESIQPTRHLQILRRKILGSS